MRRLLGLWGVAHAAMCVAFGERFTADALSASFAIALAACSALWTLGGFARLFEPKAGKPRGDPLDRTVLRWNATDRLSVRDLLSGGVAIFGRPGSGKTSSSGRLLMKSILELGNSGLLILASKPEDRADIERLVAQCGRSKDLRIVEPGGKEKCNFSESIGNDSRDATKFLMTVSETLKSGDTGGGEKEQFWHLNIERVIHAAAEMCRQAYVHINPYDVFKYIMSAPLSPAQIEDPKWKQGFFSRTMAIVHAREKTRVEKHDYDLYKEQMLYEWSGMADKTRSGILAGINAILHVLNSGIVREMVSSETTISPADLEKGAIILIDMPIMKYGESAKVVLGGWKYITQRHMLKRKANSGDAIVGIWCDEAQNVVNSFDFHYVSESRSHLGFMVYLTQSIHSYYSALKGESGKHLVDGLLTGFLHKIFHTVGDAGTAQYASSLLGKKLDVFIGGSSKQANSWQDEVFGNIEHNGSFNENYTEVLQSTRFLSGMRTGGPDCGFVVDGIVIRNGERFSTGENYLFATFPQK